MWKAEKQSQKQLKNNPIYLNVFSLYFFRKGFLEKQKQEKGLTD
ncbi:Uncharacterised protein [Niallia circulans]|nr:Uncharacterised protein [Niallia circulans]